jgi:hypothetical protein
MPLTTTIPQAELAYQASVLYEGQTYKLFLALNPGGLTAESTVAQWEAAECSGSGYAAATGTVAAGAWDAVDLRYEVPTLSLTVSATGNLSYDTLVTKIGSRTYCANVTNLGGTVNLTSGQMRVYQVQLAQND